MTKGEIVRVGPESEKVGLDRACWRENDGDEKLEAVEEAFARSEALAEEFKAATRDVDAANEVLTGLKAELDEHEQRYLSFMDTVDPDAVTPEDFATYEDLFDKYEAAHDAYNEKAAAYPLLESAVTSKITETEAAVDEANRLADIYNAVVIDCEIG